MSAKRNIPCKSIGDSRKSSQLEIHRGTSELSSRGICIFADPRGFRKFRRDTAEVPRRIIPQGEAATRLSLHRSCAVPSGLAGQQLECGS